MAAPVSKDGEHLTVFTLRLSTQDIELLRRQAAVEERTVRALARRYIRQVLREVAQRAE